MKKILLAGSSLAGSSQIENEIPHKYSLRIPEPKLPNFGNNYSSIICTHLTFFSPFANKIKLLPDGKELNNRFLNK